MELWNGQLWSTTPFLPCTSLKTMYVFGFCGCKNTCVLHNLSQLKFISGGCARPVMCLVCKCVQFLLAHSDAGLGTCCPAVIREHQQCSSYLCWGWKTSVGSQKLLSFLIFFSVPCLRDTRSCSRCWLNWFGRNGEWERHWVCPLAQGQAVWSTRSALILLTNSLCPNL